MKTKTFLAVSFGLLVLLFASACGGGSDAVPTQSAEEEDQPVDPTADASPNSPTEKADASDQGAVKTVKAEIIDTDFRPLTITVQPGTKIKWTQIGDQPHSVTAADDTFDSSPKCGPLDSDECLGMSDDFSFVFEKPGTYVYYCRVHGLPDGTGMVGEVVVE